MDKTVTLDAFHSLDGTIHLKLLFQLSLVHVRSQIPNVQHLHLYHKRSLLHKGCGVIIILYLVESKIHAIVVATDTQETQG